MSRGGMFRGDSVVLKPEEFRVLRDIFAARTGLHFGPDARFTLERRLRERLEVLGLTSFSEYYHYLRFSPRADVEWNEAVDILTTNETYFFREEHQLRAFKDELLPILSEQAKQRRRLNIWSAGCSTGEEVYTIAILLEQAGFLSRATIPTPPWDVRVFGSDISRRCIAHARRGLYGTSSFRSTAAEVREKYFIDGAQGSQPVQYIRDVCQFGQVNLLDDERARVIGRADAIFCRNVLIYFDAHARRRVIDMFLERLYPGGVLLLGHSESLLNVSTAFELLHLKGDLVYRKPLTQTSLFRDPSNFGKPNY